MRRIVFILLTFLLTGRFLAGEQQVAENELTTLKRDYADVLALQGTSKREILAIARILRAKPEVAIDQTAASGEYCFNSGLGTMVHFATQPERTQEDVVYEFDASGLIAAGLDPARLPTATRTRPNDTWRVVFSSKGAARSASRPCDAQPNDCNRCQHQVKLSFCRDPLPRKSRNRRNRLSSNSS